MIRRLLLLAPLLVVVPRSALAQPPPPGSLEVLPPSTDGSEDDDGENSSKSQSKAADADYDFDAEYEESGAHLQLGLRLGFGFPLGEAQGSSSMSDSFLGQVPIQFDIGYKFSPKFVFGAYVQYGFVIWKNASNPGDPGCPDGSSCSGGDVRLGVEGLYTFAPEASTRGWIGVGAGYEFFNGKVDDFSSQLRGWEYVNLQGGVDFATSPTAAIGPFAMFTVDSFDHFSVETPAGTNDGSVFNTSNHEWLIIGIRGTSDL